MRVRRSIECCDFQRLDVRGALSFADTRECDALANPELGELSGAIAFSEDCALCDEDLCGDHRGRLLTSAVSGRWRGVPTAAAPAAAACHAWRHGIEKHPELERLFPRVDLADLTRGDDPDRFRLLAQNR